MRKLQVLEGILDLLAISCTIIVSQCLSDMRQAYIKQEYADGNFVSSVTSYMYRSALLLQMEGHHREIHSIRFQDSIYQHLHHAPHSPLHYIYRTIHINLETQN